MSMRKFLVYNDGQRYELSPIRYEEFVLCKELYKEGGSDIEFDAFLRKHEYHELNEFHLYHEAEDRGLIAGVEYWVEIEDTSPDHSIMD